MIIQTSIHQKFYAINLLWYTLQYQICLINIRPNLFSLLGASFSSMYHVPSGYWYIFYCNSYYYINVFNKQHSIFLDCWCESFCFQILQFLSCKCLLKFLNIFLLIVGVCFALYNEIIDSLTVLKQMVAEAVMNWNAK